MFKFLPYVWNWTLFVSSPPLLNHKTICNFPHLLLLYYITMLKPPRHWGWLNFPHLDNLFGTMGNTWNSPANTIFKIAILCWLLSATLPKYLAYTPGPLWKHYTVRSRYIAVISLWRSHERRPIARLWGRDMGCRSWMQSLAEVLSL